MAVLHDRVVVPLSELTAHPRNYRAHPSDQLKHIEQSLKEHGLYRNVVVARDNTILAGHGVVQAAKNIGWTEIAVVRLDLSPGDPRALKLLAADNELSRFAEVDDRALTELLKEISATDEFGLFGTGYDEMQLAALAMVTRPASEIETMDEAAEWAGMPEFEPHGKRILLILQFEDERFRTEVIEKLNLVVSHKGQTYSAWYPRREKVDAASLMYVTDGEDEPIQDLDAALAS